MNNFLDRIKQSVLRRVSDMAIERPMICNQVDFKKLFSNPKPIIAEIKYASPTQGLLHKAKLEPVTIANQYQLNGCSALSILTEPDYFNGHIQYISQVRSKFPEMPILLKDFVISDQQIFQALQHGANAVLLIAALLPEDEMYARYQTVKQLNMTPVVEVNSLDELKRILPLQPEVVLVNNRDLNTHQIRPQISEILIKYRPLNCKMICASGLKTVQDIKQTFSLGYDACLIGTALMRCKQPGHAFKQMIKGVNHAR